MNTEQIAELLERFSKYKLHNISSNEENDAFENIKRLLELETQRSLRGLPTIIEERAEEEKERKQKDFSFGDWLES